MAALPSFYTEDTPASANEIWLRLHSDPLFAVRPPRLASAACHGASLQHTPVSGPHRPWLSVTPPHDRWAPLQIKQQEIAARKSVAANPLKMDAIKREVAALQQAKEARRAARRRDREAGRALRQEAKQAAKQVGGRGVPPAGQLRVWSAELKPAWAGRGF